MPRGSGRVMAAPATGRPKRRAGEGSAQRRTGRGLATSWNLPVSHSLFRETGDWYHQLKRFPGALLDANGFVIFRTEAAFKGCPGLRFRKGTTEVPDGIR